MEINDLDLDSFRGKFTAFVSREPHAALVFYADGRVTVEGNLKPDELAAGVLECLATQWGEKLEKMVAARMSAS